MAYFVAQLPTLSAANVSAFLYLYPNVTLGKPGKPVATFQAVFVLPEPASASTLEDLWAPYWAHVNKTYPDNVLSQATSSMFPNLYSLFLEYADTSSAGVDKVVGSWLLPSETLTEDAMHDALIDFVGMSGARLYMVSGKGVWDAEPRAGSNAVNPAWRKALIHAG